MSSLASYLDYTPEDTRRQGLASSLPKRFARQSQTSSQRTTSGFERPPSTETSSDEFYQDERLRNPFGRQSESTHNGYALDPYRHGSYQYRSAPGIVPFGPPNYPGPGRYAPPAQGQPPWPPTYYPGMNYNSADPLAQPAEQNKKNLNSDLRLLREELDLIKAEKQQAQLQEENRTKVIQLEMKIFKDEIINQAIRQIQNVTSEKEAVAHDRDREILQGEPNSQRMHPNAIGDRQEESDRRHSRTYLDNLDYRDLARLASRFYRETDQRKKTAERSRNRPGQSNRVRPRRDTGQQQPEQVFIPRRRKETEYIKPSQPGSKRVVMSGALPLPRIVSKPGRTKGPGVSENMAQDTLMNDPSNVSPQDSRRPILPPSNGRHIPGANFRKGPPAPTAEDATASPPGPPSAPLPVPSLSLSPSPLRRETTTGRQKKLKIQIPSPGSVGPLSERNETHHAGQAAQYAREQDSNVLYGDEALRHFESVPGSKYSPAPRRQMYNGIPGMSRGQTRGETHNDTGWGRVGRDQDEHSPQSGIDDHSEEDGWPEEDRDRKLHAHVEDEAASPAPEEVDSKEQTYTGSAMDRDLNGFHSRPQSGLPSEDRSTPSVLDISQPGPHTPQSESVSLSSVDSPLRRDGLEQFRLSPESLDGQRPISSSQSYADPRGAQSRKPEMDFFMFRRFKKNMYDAMMDALYDAYHCLQPPAVHVIPTMATMLQVPQVIMKEARPPRKSSLFGDDTYLSLDDDSDDRTTRTQRRSRRDRRHKRGPGSSQLSPEHHPSHTDDFNFSPSKGDDETHGGVQHSTRDDATVRVDGHHGRSNDPGQPEQDLNTLLAEPAIQQRSDSEPGNALADYTGPNGGEDAHDDVLESDSEQSFKTASAGSSRRGSFEGRNGPDVRPTGAAMAVEALQLNHSDDLNSQWDSDSNESRSTAANRRPPVATPPSAETRDKHYRPSHRVRLAKPTMMMVPVAALSYYLVPLGHHGARNSFAVPHQHQWFSQPSSIPRAQARSETPEPASKDLWDRIRRQRHQRYKDEESESGFESSEESEDSYM